MHWAKRESGSRDDWEAAYSDPDWLDDDNAGGLQVPRNGVDVRQEQLGLALRPALGAVVGREGRMAR